jgi:FkbH-like protein
VTEAGPTREDVDALVAGGDAGGAAAALGALWRREPKAATAGFVLSRFTQIAQALPLRPLRLWIARSYTVEPLLPVLRVEAYLLGIELEIGLGGFGTYVQDLIDADSDLYAFDPDVVLLAADSRDVAPDLWGTFTDLGEAGTSAAVERVLDRYRMLVEALRGRSAAQLLIQGLEVPAAPAAGILDAQLPIGQADAFRRINLGLGELARAHRSAYVLDHAALVAKHGAGTWHDRHRWRTARLPVAAAHVVDLAREWARFLPPLAARTCKVLAVDLDNTLWGGVIGEDGLDGIQLGDDEPGSAYLDLQRAILDLTRRGIVLAVCSKNNPDEALEALRTHPAMLLRPDDFAALRITWADKAASLREIATELDLGLDAIAFLDDNPVERAWVRDQLPQVTVIDLPDDPASYAATLARCPVFERLSVTSEDRKRTEYYVQERRRGDLQRGADSLEDFYRSLEMTVEIERVHEATLPRAAQLTQKTNQFNLTTRRYSEEQIRALESDGAAVYTLRAADRFGDSGIVGVAIALDRGASWELDSFLLSCRVIGRTIETALLATVADDARRAGAERLTGSFLPTAKNAPARGFYAAHGFECIEDGDAETRWELDLDRAPGWPAWIERVDAAIVTPE